MAFMATAHGFFLQPIWEELSQAKPSTETPSKQSWVHGSATNKGLLLMRIFYRGISRYRNLLPVQYTIALEYAEQWSAYL